MRAVVQDEYGTEATEVLRLDEVERPTPGEGEVLVRVEAAGVDRGTWHLMAGRPWVVRLAGFGVRRPKYRIPGLDLAGTVEAVGPGVEGLAAGDEVFGSAGPHGGSFAEYVVASADRLARKPANLSWEQAAVVPISGMTGLQAVRDVGGVEPGQRVLVVGASGGVGSYATQVAKALGAEVTGVASTAKLDLVRELGADDVIDYTAEDFTDGSRQWDVIVDTGGNTPLRALRRALTSKGRLVIVGSETDGKLVGGTDRQARAAIWSLFVGQKLGSFISKENAADLDALRDLIEEGAVTPALDRTYPLAEAPTAVADLRAGRARGKLAVTV